LDFKHFSVFLDFIIGVPSAPSVSHHGIATPMTRKMEIFRIEAIPKYGDSTGSSGT
jgi:hypothetical protein